MQRHLLRTRPMAAVFALAVVLQLLPQVASAADACADETNVSTGTLSGPGDAVMLPADGYSAGETVHVGCVEGDAGLDLELTLIRAHEGEDLVVESADESAGQERLHAYQTAGEFHWVVTSVAGSGAYTFGYSFALPAIGTSCSDRDHHAQVTLDVPGDAVEMPVGGYVTGGLLLHDGCLHSPSTDDFDLKLARIEADGQRTILATGVRYRFPNGYLSERPGSERIEHAEGPGTYVWIIESVDGSATVSWGYSTREPDGPSELFCYGEEEATGRLDGLGDELVVPLAAPTPEDVELIACVASAEGTDVDLVLQRRASNGAYVDVADSRDGARYEAVRHAVTPGQHRWVVRSAKGAGDVRLAYWATPSTSFSSTPPARTDSTEASFVVTSNEEGAGARCSLDGGPAYNCAGFTTVRNLSLGRHRIVATAFDADGYEDATPAVWEWEIVKPEPPTPATAPLGSEVFSDVEAGHPFDREIGRLYASGVTRGCGDGRFCATDEVTRGQMAAFLGRALGIPTGTAVFSDTRGHRFEADIAALADAGITRGCGGTAFCPARPVTRGQMAAFLKRALRLGPGTTTFADTRGHQFEADIAALADAGITSGCGGTAFCPDRPVTRAQMAAFLDRAGLLD